MQPQGEWDGKLYEQPQVKDMEEYPSTLIKEHEQVHSQQYLHIRQEQAYMKMAQEMMHGVVYVLYDHFLPIEGWTLGHGNMLEFD